MKWSYRAAGIVLIVTLVASQSNAQGLQPQTDWSGGPGEPGPVMIWEDGFSEAQDISAVAVPGQFVLSATPRATPVQTVVAGDAQHPGSIAAADLDGDGLEDMVVAHGVTDPFLDIGEIRWWRQSAPGVWEMRSVSTDFYGAHFVETVDLDLDGDLDIIATAYFGNPPDPGGLPNNGRFAWFENVDGQGGQWQQWVVGELFNGAEWIDCGDIDGDGDNDLVGTSWLTDGIYNQDADVVWFENLDEEGTQWAQHDVDLDHPNGIVARLADLDGDSDLDIVVGNSDPFTHSNFHWWENDLGDGTVWTKRMIPFHFNGAGYLDVGDIDGDGDIDLMGGGYQTGALGFWENLDGLGETWNAVPVATLIQGLVVRIADLDGDGDLDVLAASNQGGQHSGMWWYVNTDGVGGVWDLRTIDHLGTNGAWVDVGDPDGDGRLDAVVSQDDFYLLQTEQIAWWKLTDFVSSGQLTSSVLNGVEPSWGPVQWDATIGAQSTLAVEVRASDDPDDLGPWFEVAASGDPLAPLIGTSPQYFQYRVTVSSSDPNESPLFREITVDTGVVTGLFFDDFETGDTSRWSASVPVG